MCDHKIRHEEYLVFQLNHKNSLIELSYREWHLALRSKGAQMQRGSMVDDDVATFMAKQCHRSPEQIYDLFLSDETTYGHVVTAYRYHVLDRIRKENGKKKIKLTELNHNNSNHNKTTEDSHDFIVDEMKEGYKKIVAERFSNPEFHQTFALIAEGYDNNDIAEVTGIGKRRIASIRHQIKRHLTKVR